MPRYSPLYLFCPDSSENIDTKESTGQRKHFQNECGTADCVLLWSAPWWLNTLCPLKRWKDEESSVSCSASAVSLKLFKFVHCIPLPLFSAAKRSFEPTCHSAGRSTSMWLQTSQRWANIHAACPCSAYCLGTQTGHKQDNLIVPRCVPHGSVLSGFADGELSGVLPPDLLTWWQPGGLIKLQLTWFMHKNRLRVCTEHSVISVSLLFFLWNDWRQHRTLVHSLHLPSNINYCIHPRLLPLNIHLHTMLYSMYINWTFAVHTHCSVVLLVFYFLWSFRANIKSSLLEYVEIG